MIVFLIDSDSGGVVLHHTTQEPLPELLQWPARPIYVSLGGGDGGLSRPCHWQTISGRETGNLEHTPIQFCS